MIWGGKMGFRLRLMNLKLQIPQFLGDNHFLNCNFLNWLGAVSRHNDFLLVST